jgi:uncharacterized membrane protein
MRTGYERPDMPLVTDTAAPPARRLISVDALRGCVMVLMALDHTRDFIHAGAMVFSPEDLARTTPVLFMTRWITHVCAPTFVVLAGAGAFLRLERGGSRARLARFLWTRGVWLVLLELTVMRLAMTFSFDLSNPILILILCALGGSMIALAALVHLPARALLVLSVGVIALHNLFDGVQASSFGGVSWVWNVLHQPGVFVVRGVAVVVGYPLVPWFAVMAGGFCFGRLLLWQPAERRRALIVLGSAMVAGFLVLRAVNVYGDPSPWSPQETTTLTVLSLLRTTKYPPSLQFLLMTLGPAFLTLAWLDGREGALPRVLVSIGRVPLFFYVVHFWALHVIAALLAWLHYGRASRSFLFHPLPSMGGARELFPAGFGYPIWTVYVVWIGVVAAMYPLCRWFGAVKVRRREWWMSYF